ncbi:MAG: CvpA family protein [Alphaproteobacteria bacterium]|nr:CvpA family protein [Alphaproteobacteria bacterium]
MENICGVDIFIAVVLAVSAVLSFFRGFASEMLGVGSWIVSGVAGFYAMPYLEPFMLKYVHKPLFANLISLTVVAVATLVVLTIVCSKITGKVRKSVLNRLDHFLGFIFGGLRGVVILVLIYFLMMTLAPKNLEQIQKKSKAFPYLERVTESVKEHLPESLFDNPTKPEDKKSDEIEELIEKLNTSPQKKNKKTTKESPQKQEEKPVDPEKKNDLFEALNDPQVEEKSVDSEKQGYNKKEREQLDKLFLESIEEADSVAD